MTSSWARAHGLGELSGSSWVLLTKDIFPLNPMDRHEAVWVLSSSCRVVFSGFIQCDLSQ